MFKLPNPALALLFLFPAFLSGAEKISSALVVPQALVNEPVVLNIQIPGERPLGQLATTEPTSLKLAPIDPDVINRQIFCSNITVRSESAGRQTIPPLKVPLRSGESLTRATTLFVHGTEGIDWNTVSIDGQTYRIGSILLVPPGKIYEGQSIPVTAKVLVPASLPVFNYGYAEVEKENIGVWRLDPAFPPNYNNQRVEPRVPNATQPQHVLIDGESYQVVNFTAAASPLKDGAVKVGPGKIQNLQVEVRQTMEANRGLFRGSFSRSVSLNLDLGEASFTASPLPAGAPPEFAGAVGSFTLDTRLDGETLPQPGDPIQVKIEVAGQGNLAGLSAPVADTPESNWKIYPASRNDQQSDRRGDEGTVVFSQLMRPLVPVKEIPPFVLSFFDPVSGKYETLRSKPIPVTLSPAKSGGGVPPAPGLVPVPEMTDILGLVDPRPFRRSIGTGWLKYWQIIPALGVLALGGIALKRQLRKQKSVDPRKQVLRKELDTLQETADPLVFLRSACSLAEREGLANEDGGFVRDLLDKRDRVCFQPKEEEPDLSPTERSEIISKLKGRLLLALALLLTAFALPRAEASLHDDALAAWNDAKYEQAKELYELSLKEGATPDLLYNLGNCYYRLDQPAMAALQYRRALELDPNHGESRQNLAFLNRKLGAIPPLADGTPAWARWLSPLALKNLLVGMAWILALAILARAAFPTRVGRGLVVAAIPLTISLALVAGILLWKHPGDELKPVMTDALLISKEPVAVKTEASEAGSTILSANPATPCRIIAERGAWTFVELPDRTHGWLPSENLVRIHKGEA